MAHDRPSIEDLLKKEPPSKVPKVKSETKPREQLEEKFADLRLKEKESEAQADAAQLGIPYINLQGFPIGPETIALIPRKQAEQHSVVCFFNNGSEVRIGALSPKDAVIEEIRFQVAERAHGHAVVYRISEHSFQQAFKIYDTLPSIREISKGVNVSEAELARFAEITTFEKLQAALKGANVTDVVTILIAGSLNARSSDIHVEAEESEIAVRYRVDGVLVKVASIDGAQWSRIISRIKLLSGLKLNVTSTPQDGRFTIFADKEKIDVRVSTIPTAYGESVVMRLLRPSATGMQLELLGVREPYASMLAAQIERPNGMIVTTGPTGSGKTTTLYAILQKLNQPDVKIITLEDPVEYKLAGVAQSQIDHEKEYTFAKGLRSILRQDPDVIMVGEIRDLETAEVAIQAALTGHLLLSTIHTNDAAGAIPRFMSMGVKPFLLAPAMNVIIGQRLVRTIHADCKEEVAPSEADLAKAKAVLAEMPKNSGVKTDTSKLVFYRGKGCAGCGNIGFKGRIGIYELLIMNPEIEKVILSGQVSEYQMRDIAKAAGMITMAQDGVLKALEGVTTLDEVFRVAE